MTSRPLVLTTAFVTCLWMGLAAAAEAQAQTRFPGLDRNNDGQITREEWRGSDRSFQTHDWNNDGVLSGDEVRPGAQRNSNWETADHDPNRYPANENRNQHLETILCKMTCKLRRNWYSR